MGIVWHRVVSEVGEPLLGRAARAAIYIVRDPCDVAISYAYHYGTTINGAIAAMNSTDHVLAPGGMGLGSQLRQKLRNWSTHVASWFDQADTPVHMVRYEDLKTDTVAQFARALAFAGMEIRTGDIECAVHHADFSQLQHRERETGFSEQGFGGAAFFRSGKAGERRKVLTPAQRACIEDAHATVMDRLGYARG